MRKKGQFQLSFGMIFSIIIIIAIVGVSFYVITKFIGTSKCTEIALFYDSLKSHTEKAWRSTINKDTFTFALPSGIEEVCFGDISQSKRDEIKKEFVNSNGNVFLYPARKACDSTLSSIKLEHVTIPSFFCVKAEDNKISIKTSKTQFEPLVTISE